MEKSISHLFQTSSVSHYKDGLSILKSTVLDPFGEGLRLIVEGNHVAVKALGISLIVSFSSGRDDAICDVETRKNLKATRTKLKEVWEKKEKNPHFLQRLKTFCYSITWESSMVWIAMSFELATVLFEKFQTYFLSTSNPDRFTDKYMIKTCRLYSDILITINTLTSK
jgi:hypothetical protein